MYKGYDFYHPTVKAEYSEKHNYWILLRGPETFFDDERRLRNFDIKEDALVRNNHPEYEIIEFYSA